MESDVTLGNPLLEAFVRLDDAARASARVREELVARYSFAIPTVDVLEHICAASPGGIVEVGAGTGYWAWLLDQRGTRVRAYDIAPPPSHDNQWFASSTPWHDVRPGTEEVVDDAPPASLLLVWPTRNETWATAAAQRHHAAGGASLVYVGEGPGGRSGDDTFHAVLGETTQCLHCSYGVETVPCICSIRPLWHRVAEHQIPTWPGYHDTVRLYEPRQGKDETWPR